MFGWFKRLLNKQPAPDESFDRLDHLEGLEAEAERDAAEAAARAEQAEQAADSTESESLAAEPEPEDLAAEAPRGPSAFDRLVLDQLSENERRLADKVLADLDLGSIELPTLPDLAIAVGRAVNNPDASMDDLARLIQVDVPITAKVIQVANSAVFGGYSQVSTLPQAITRLGLQHTRDIVTSLALKQLFKSDQPELQRRMRELWQSSAKIAAISSVLARFADGIDSERAMLAGLMHDIGVLTIIQYVSKEPAGTYTEMEINSAIDHLKGMLGSKVLQNWNFDGDLAMVPMAVVDMEEYLPGPITYCDVVRIAKLHSLFGTPELEQYPPMAELPAFKKFGFRVAGPDRSIEALREAKADIDAVRATLNI